MRSSFALVPFLVLGLVFAGCGGDDDESSPSTEQDAGVDVEAGQDVAADVREEPSIDAPVEAAEDAPLDAPLDAPHDVVDAGPPPEPTPADIQFQATNPIPSGELLLFNDWNASPNTVSSVTLDGQTTTEIFRAYSVWSMGVSRGNDRIAFSCGDPNQEQNYGIATGSAIQHTWMYDVAAQSVEVLAYGNINDECHTFGPGDERLYLCRRYEFDAAGGFKGYRIGAIDLATNDFEFLTPEQPMIFTLHPQPTPDESEMYYSLIDIPASPPGGVRSIRKQSLPSGTDVPIRAEADAPLLSPDGSRYLYRNYLDNGTLWSSSIDGQTTHQVVASRITEPVWSPDGTRVAFLLPHDTLNCDHIYVAAADGSQADNPVQVRDCAVGGEYITELDWIVVP
jgi:WD40-like Beta Propeller Repeat